MAPSREGERAGDKTVKHGARSSESGLSEIDSLFDNKRKQESQKKASAAATDKQKTGKGGRRKRERAAGDATEADWVDDGLGGRYNYEGYTGRVEKGIRIFKRHVMNKPGSGTTKDCPFDCDCCVI